MCYFVTLGITDKANATIEAISKERYGFSFSPVTSPFVSKLFPSSDSLFYVTHGGCSCDLYDSGQGDDLQKFEDYEAKYRRKGWSEAKIKRAMADRSKPRHSPPKSDYQSKFNDTVSRLVQQFGSVRLFAHMFAGEVETEEVDKTGRSTVNVADFISEGGHFAPDTVVEVRRGAG